jgi:cytochrome c
MKYISFSCILLIAATAAGAEDIHVASKEGDMEKIKALLAEGVPADQPSTRDTSTIGATALFMAVKWNRQESAELLLDAGADPVFPIFNDGQDTTPITLAVQYGRVEMIKMFLDRGADPDGPSGGSPPLHFARLMKRPEIEELLIKYGASLSITQPPISHLLADADVERGRRLGQFCANCHGKYELRDKTGTQLPSLWEIVGRGKGSLPDIEYSEAMNSAGGTWTFDELNSFLARPGGLIPGTPMWGILTPSEQARIDIIAFLRTLSDDPHPLP